MLVVVLVMMAIMHDRGGGDPDALFVHVLSHIPRIQGVKILLTCKIRISRHVLQNISPHNHTSYQQTNPCTRDKKY